MDTPTIEEARKGTKVRSTVSENRFNPKNNCKIEVFKRASDGTFWWVKTRCADDGDPMIVQVEEVPTMIDGKPAVTYHQIRAKA